MSCLPIHSECCRMWLNLNQVGECLMPVCKPPPSHQPNCRPAGRDHASWRSLRSVCRPNLERNNTSRNRAYRGAASFSISLTRAADCAFWFSHHRGIPAEWAHGAIFSGGAHGVVPGEPGAQRVGAGAVGRGLGKANPGEVLRLYPTPISSGIFRKQHTVNSTRFLEFLRQQRRRGRYSVTPFQSTGRKMAMGALCNTFPARPAGWYRSWRLSSACSWPIWDRFTSISWRRREGGSRVEEAAGCTRTHRRCAAVAQSERRQRNIPFTTRRGDQRWFRSMWTDQKELPVKMRKQVYAARCGPATRLHHAPHGCEWLYVVHF